MILTYLISFTENEMTPDFRDSLTHKYILLKTVFVNAFYPEAEKNLETMKLSSK